jgi:hypothetical protein
METAIIYLLVFALGWWAGSKLTASLNRIVFTTILKELGITEKQLRQLAKDNKIIADPSDLEDAADPEDDLTTIDVRIEEHQGQIYAYRRDNNEFLAQGTTKDQLINHVRSRMDNVRLIITEGEELLQKYNS